jgi:glycosyltransferase involved in cell wall biosynthesis
MLPKVSVIIPAYNSSAWIRECINSVLRQSYPNLEIIVVDDGSRDSTPEILREFDGKIRVLQQEHVGIGAARNAGIGQAEGEFLAFLDSDDVWVEEKMAKQVEFLLNNPQYCVIYSDASEFDDSGTHKRTFFENFPSLASDEDIAENMVLRRAIPLTSTVAVRGEFLRRYGLRFHPKASCAEDLSLFLEIYLHAGKFGRLDEPLARRRLHSANSSGDHYNRFFQRIAVYGDMLRRYPDAPPRTRKLLRAGLRDANFRVGDLHWGGLDLQTARAYFRAGISPDLAGVRCGCFWILTFAPREVILVLKKLKQRVRRKAHSDKTSPVTAPVEGSARD